MSGMLATMIFKRTQKSARGQTACLKFDGLVPAEIHLVIDVLSMTGWQDFMDFDVNVKHKMAITASEFGLLLQQASLSTAGWDVCVDRKEIKVLGKKSNVQCMLRFKVLSRSIRRLVAVFPMNASLLVAPL
eukprot:2340184-Amphidinium_carterae.1